MQTIHEACTSCHCMLLYLACRASQKQKAPRPHPEHEALLCGLALAWGVDEAKSLQEAPTTAEAHTQAFLQQIAKSKFACRLSSAHVPTPPTPQFARKPLHDGPEHQTAYRLHRQWLMLTRGCTHAHCVKKDPTQSTVTACSKSQPGLWLMHTFLFTEPIHMT